MVRMLRRSPHGPACLLERLPETVPGILSALYPASSSSERVSYNRINKKTGNRLKQQNVDADTGEPVDREDIGRGYEIGKGQYLQVEDDELEKIEIENTHTIAIDSFVPRSEIDDRYLDSSYYIAPTD
jgi:DNA end-binding protein Ku